MKPVRKEIDDYGTQSADPLPYARKYLSSLLFVCLFVLLIIETKRLSLPFTNEIIKAVLVYCFTVTNLRH